jgi:uncharacterized membrane protein YcaP (DUF421 family)
MQTFWTDVLVPGIPMAEKVFRTVVVYVFLLAGLQLAGKRELGQLNPFDLVVLLLLSNAVQNAIIGNDNSLLGGIVGAVTLLVVNYLVVRFLYTHPGLDSLVEGSPEVLILNGELQKPALKHNLITVPELEAAARRQGIEDLARVRCSRLEIGGTISFVLKDPSPEEARHDELLERLGTLERQLSDLLQREAADRGPVDVIDARGRGTE